MLADKMLAKGCIYRISPFVAQNPNRIRVGSSRMMRYTACVFVHLCGILRAYMNV